MFSFQDFYNNTYLDYYYYTNYEIETFENLISAKYILDVLNKVFVVMSILLCLADFLLLVTVFSAQARQQSAIWYLYHFNFLTILHVIFSLQTLEGTFHKSFGSCMFFHFTYWVFVLLFNANLVLMDIEIIATVFTASPRWKTCPKKRFFIAMTAVWNSCLLTSVIITFFGHEEHEGIPICFNQNSAVQRISVVVRDWTPCIISAAFSIAGLVFFIRTKRRREDYSHVTDRDNSVQKINEWFACFMVWNTFVGFSKIVSYVMHLHFYTIGLTWTVVFQIVMYLLQIGLPITGAFLEPVRTVCKKWAIEGFRCMTGSKRTPEVSDTQQLTEITEVETT